MFFANSRLRSQNSCEVISTEKLEAYLDKALSDDLLQAVEAHLATCPACRERLVALFRVRQSLAYLTASVREGKPQPELTLSPQLMGYGALQLESVPKRMRAYAASSHAFAPRFILQSISQDKRLLVTLRHTSKHKWQLIARLAPQGTWHLQDDLALVAESSDAEVPDESLGLLCLLVRVDNHAIIARLGAPLDYEESSGHYVAGVELPLSNLAMPIVVEYGLVPRHALRWLHSCTGGHAPAQPSEGDAQT